MLRRYGVVSSVKVAPHWLMHWQKSAIVLVNTNRETWARFAASTTSRVPYINALKLAVEHHGNIEHVQGRCMDNCIRVLQYLLQDKNSRVKAKST